MGLFDKFKKKNKQITFIENAGGVIITKSIYEGTSKLKWIFRNEKQREYLFLGESNISWYVYQYKNQCYMELDRPSGREIHRFRNFYEMFDKVLSEAIMG